MKIEINVPDNFNITHAMQSVQDALDTCHNVTPEENDRINQFLVGVKNAMPQMKRFNVIYYGVVDALNESDARIIADTFSPKNRECYISGYKGSYKYVHDEVRGCVPEDTKEYFVDGYHNSDPFSVFYNQKIILTERELREALIPDNPKSRVTITKKH